MSIYWREKPIHKAKEPPRHIECNCNWEEDYTATKNWGTVSVLTNKGKTSKECTQLIS